MPYAPDAVIELYREFSRVREKYMDLLSQLVTFAQVHRASSEYVFHGFLRRLGTLERCIQNVYSLYAPDRSDIPTRETCVDLGINLQSFILNVFGCLDNLARIQVTEHQLTDKKGKPLTGNRIAFRNDILIQSFSADFQSYLSNLEQWFGYLENFRHALAHRIPLYVAPFVLAPEKKALFDALEGKKSEALRRRDFERYDELDTQQIGLGRFMPAMTHSFYEKDTHVVNFHSQTVVDWRTLAEITDRFLQQSNWPASRSA